MSLPDLRPLTFGEVLDGSFTLYRRHFLTMFVTALIPLVPMALLWTEVFRVVLSQGPQVDTEALEQLGGMMVLLWLVGWIGFTLMWSALARQFSEGYGGGEVSLADGWRQALRAFFPLLGVGALVAIAAVAVSIALTLAVFVVGLVLAFGQSETAGVIIALLLWLGMIVVFLVAAAFLFAVVPAVVVERLGPVDAIGRSFRLARGAVGRLVGLILVCGVLAWIPGFGAAWVVALATGTGGEAQEVPVRAFLLQQAVSVLAWAVSNPFVVGCLVLQYYDRRVRTEAYDLELATAELAALR